MSSPSSGHRRNLSAVSTDSSSQSPTGKRVKKNVEREETKPSTSSDDDFEFALLEALEQAEKPVQERPADEGGNNEHALSSQSQTGSDGDLLNAWKEGVKVTEQAEGDQKQTQQGRGQQSNENANLPENLKKYMPAKEYVFEPGNPDHDTYYASAYFEADPCPPEVQHRELEDSSFTWEEIPEGSYRGEPGVYSDGTKKRLRARKSGDTGHHITALNFERMSATDKYLQWRERILSLPDRRAHKRKPRKITLGEYEPYGQKGEGDKWALKVKQLDRMLKTLAPKSHVTMILVVKSNKFVHQGHYRNWYDAILEILHKYPNNFAVQLEDTSILDFDYASILPVAREYTDVDVCLINSLVEDVPEDVIEAKRQELNEGAKITNREECQRIEGHIEHCRRFVEEVQRIQGQSPPAGSSSQEKARKASVTLVLSGRSAVPEDPQ
ncbi:hypothetical protein K491DRAFT_699710 [Lophiostoma macrostomum CBS 122681]|uniref:Uncharacterized protein n=1 Tax=Lophiostoma macrostomum CBS 122681 TaxID=1314788 RepID=A0A6A6SHQ8_9PLEO|nr:hypothetical protein K491DRAFT_699710 [Lophiostoma macrostomum CBS 122681]